MGSSVIYQRQDGLGLHVPSEVSIVGCGGVGAWVAIDLAMIGVQKINLFDFDNLEMHNINRVPFGPADVGKQKTELVQEFIARIRPDTEVICLGRLSEITQELLKGNVVDCTDKVAIQAFIQSVCGKQGLPYFRIGYDGHHITVVDGRASDAVKAADVWSDGSGREGYTTVASWVAPPQIGAAMLTYIMCSGRTFSPVSTDIFELANITQEKAKYGR